MEETDSMVHKANTVYKKNEPLINYLEAEVLYCRIMPQEFRRVS